MPSPRFRSREQYLCKSALSVFVFALIDIRENPCYPWFFFCPPLAFPTFRLRNNIRAIRAIRVQIKPRISQITRIFSVLSVLSVFNKTANLFRKHLKKFRADLKNFRADLTKKSRAKRCIVSPRNVALFRPKPCSVSRRDFFVKWL